MVGGLAQAQHRFGAATFHLRRAAQAAHNPGFGAAEALHLANLGRAQQQSGDHQGAKTTLERAIDAALAAGDLRLVATARVRLARVLRFLGERESAREIVKSAQRWYVSAGGGEGAALADYVLASLAVDDGAVQSLSAILEAARRAGDVEVELLTLDLMARIQAERGDLTPARATLDEADRLLPTARHLVTDSDRIDRERTLLHLDASGPR